MLGPFEGCVIPDQPNLPDPILPAGQILIYEDGATRLQVRLEGRSVWLSQRLIAELFQMSVLTANEHLANIYREGELDPKATIRSFRIVQAEGTREITRAISVFQAAMSALRSRRSSAGLPMCLPVWLRSGRARTFWAGCDLFIASCPEQGCQTVDKHRTFQ